jgi:hypothetical protein
LIVTLKHAQPVVCTPTIGTVHLSHRVAASAAAVPEISV